MSTPDLVIAGIVLWLLLGGLCLGYWIIHAVEAQREHWDGP